MNKLQRIELIKDLVQQAIDRGATSVEQIHQYIADLPFEALEKSGLIEEDPMQLREKQRRTIGVVYDAIRRINSEVGTFISEQIENLEDGQAVAEALKSQRATRRNV
jgi:polyhydroxyalkanoate synthesis regulator phasin